MSLGSYRPRHPERTPFFQCLQDYWDEFKESYPYFYEAEYGPLRSVLEDKSSNTSSSGSSPNALPHPDSSLENSRASWLRFRPNRLKPSEPPATRSSGTTSRFGKTDPPRRPGRIQYRGILAALIFPFLQPKLGLDAPITLFQPTFSFSSD